MRVLRAFARGFMQPPAAIPSFAEPVTIRPPVPVPAEEAVAELAPEPRVKLDHLLDLALIMRELWLQDAGFSGDGNRARSIVLAALLRLFPDRAEPSVAACLARPCPAGRCEDCPADAKTPAAWLDQFLDGMPRPLVVCGIPPADVDRVLTELRTAKAHYQLAQHMPAREAGR